MAMSKTLGLDLGTNSIGWAIIEREGCTTTLIDKGVHIFQEGVNRVKGKEEPTVETRTKARASRRHYFRRRLRKIELLQILVEQGWCPYLSLEELKDWKETKRFPLKPEFLEWLRTDDKDGRNPYTERHRCLNENLDLSIIKDRYTLGRALYHINQRRGFLSNRKVQNDSKEDSKVKTAISNLDKEMREAGYEYLGDYFFHLYGTGVHIRRRYTNRNEHYLKEFKAICAKQHLNPALVQRLYDAIFFQRPLKSQKGSVGKCPFEPSKSRCQNSHPDFEEFRMLSFINNIRIAKPGEMYMRPLSVEEKTKIIPLFYRKSKENFDFADISKNLAGKGQVVHFDNGRGDTTIDVYRFNFRDSTNVCGCPVSAQFIAIFGDDWKNAICKQYLLAGNKTKTQIVDDVWHVITDFDNNDKLHEWAMSKLQLNEKDAKSFVELHLPQGYASLSLCAIRKIIPWLRLGYRYDEATMLANIKSVLPLCVREDEVKLNEVMDTIIMDVTSYVPNADIKNDSKFRKIAEDLYNLGIYNININKLYHPSINDIYPKARPDKNGKVYLGSPRTDSVRNPMAMRSLFRLRALVNELIYEGKIDKYTKINIELARNLNDYNTRRAIEQLQSNNENRRETYKKAISEYYTEQGIKGEPSEDDLLKYELWEEQKHMCLYTGKQIPLSGFLGANPQFDIEHTIPRSRGGDNSKANKTLCDCGFNREVKKGRLPYELANWEEVLARLEETDFETKINSLRKEIAKATKSAKASVDKDSKNNAIQHRHIARMQMDYLTDKVKRFKMREVPEGFSNRQGVDIGIIGKYARMFMQTVFDKVFIVKGETTAEFRKMWGLQENYNKKERVNHTHHCIDAITIACIDKFEYDLWAQYKCDEESFSLGIGKRPVMPKPWRTFTEDIKSISDTLLISHYTADNMHKETKKIMRKRGVIQRSAEGTPIYLKGDTARGSLHQMTFYGAIKRGDEIKYVIRKEIASLKKDDIKNIVDDVVREKIADAVSKNGLQSLQGPIWMNKEKLIPIRKVRLFAPTVTNPLRIKKHRFLSNADYKQDLRAVNESNYAYAVYEGYDFNGKLKRTFSVVNNMDAVTSIKNKSKVVRQVDDQGFPHIFSLKTGTMVLFYENSPKELLNATNEELSRRLYKTMKFSINRYASFIHHQEARSKSDLTYRKGGWKNEEGYRPIMEMNFNQIKAFVEGINFILTTTGKIKFLEDD